MFRLQKPNPAKAWLRGLLAISPLFIVLILTGAPGAVRAVVASGDGVNAGTLGEHGLSLLPNGQMAGWGANEFAQVQTGQGDFLQNPQRISLPGTRAMAVVAGSRHSLAIDESGRVWAWGDNSSGQLGLGHTRPVPGMALVQGLPARASIISAGAQHSVVLLTDGTVWVWGANNRGQLGRGAADAFALQTSPVRVTMPGRVADVASGNDFVLALVGQRDRSGAANGAVWAWGAGNGSPHVVDGFQGASVVRAAGSLAMARTSTGGYWQWSAEQTPPGIAQRAAFEKLGQMTHPLLAAMTAPSEVPVVPRSQGATDAPSTQTQRAPRPTAVTAAVAASPAPAAATPAAAPVRITPPTPTSTPIPTLRAVLPLVAATVPSAASAPVRPAPALPPVSAAVAVGPPALPAATPAPVPVAPPAAAPAAILNLSGTVRLSAGFGGDNTGKALENVQVLADGGQCSATDSQGRYACSVPAGWSGRVTLQRGDYRFSPSALSFQNLRVNAGQQDFAAIYDPR